MNAATAGASNIRWRILALLVLASFLAYVLRFNLSAAGPTMIADLGLTEIQFGWILAAFTAGYAIFQFPGGIAVDRFGARRVLAVIMVLWALLTIVTSAIPSSGQAGTGAIIVSLIAVRFLVGVVQAPIFPLTGGVVERWFPVGGWALPNGLSSAGLTLGAAATAPLLAWMMIEFGWRASFIYITPPAFIAAALWWWYMRDTPAEHLASNQQEVDLIYADRPQAQDATDDGPAWWRVLKSRDVLLLMLSYFCMNYVFYQLFNWVFYYLETVRGFGGQEAGFLTSTQWIAGAVGAILGGLICDGLSRRIGLRKGCRIPAIVGLSLSGLFLIVGALAGNPYVAVASLAMCFFFNQITEAAFWAAAIGAGGRHAAAACGVMNTGGNTVGFVNALLVPYTASQLGWTAALATGAIFAFVGAGLWFFICPDRPVAD